MSPLAGAPEAPAVGEVPPACDPVVPPVPEGTPPVLPTKPAVPVLVPAVPLGGAPLVPAVLLLPLPAVPEFAGGSLDEQEARARMEPKRSMVGYGLTGTEVSLVDG
jgi:hypothetical protein